MEAFNHQHGQHLAIEGTSIYYEEAGNPQKPPLLFLHGGLQNIEDFNTITPFCANDFRMIGVDSRGHGKSELGKEALSYKRLQHDVEALLAYLNIRKVSIIDIQISRKYSKW